MKLLKKRWRFVATVIFILVIYYGLSALIFKSQDVVYTEVYFILWTLTLLFGGLIHYRQHFNWAFSFWIFLGALPLTLIVEANTALFFAPFFAIMGALGMAIAVSIWKFLHRWVY